MFIHPQESKGLRHILHNSHSGKASLIVFKEKDRLPAYIVNIYEKSRSGHFMRMYEYLKMINCHSSACLKGSVPRLLDYQAGSGFDLAFEEYINGENIARQAYSGGIFWKRAFFRSISIATEWLSDLHKNFSGRKVLILRDEVSFFLNKLRPFIDVSFLNITPQDTAIPTVLTHRDLIPQNLINGKGGKLIVIDWCKFDPEGEPLFDLLQLIFRYLHYRYKLQNKGLFLEPGICAKYLDLFYLKDSPISRFVREKVGLYSKNIGIDPGQRDILILLWLCSMVFAQEKIDFKYLKRYI